MDHPVFRCESLTLCRLGSLIHPTSFQDPLPLLDDPMCDLPPIMDDFDPHSLQPILTPPQPMDFFDSEYHGQPPQQQQLWQQQGRQQQRPRRQQHEEGLLPQDQRRQQQRPLSKTSVVASKQTPSSAAAPAQTTTNTTAVDRSSRSRSLFLDVNLGNVDVLDDDDVLGMSVVKRMESLEHEYKRVKRELLRGEGGGGDGDDTEDPDLWRGGQEAVCSPPFGPDIPRIAIEDRDRPQSSLRHPASRRRSTDKFLSIFGSDGDSHLNEGEDGRLMCFAAASSPCGGGGDGKAFEDCPPHPTTKSASSSSSRLRNTASKTVVDYDNDDDDEAARPLHDLADQLVELRLSLQRAEVGSRLPSRSVFTIPEEEGENYGGGGGSGNVGDGGGKEGKEGLGQQLGEDGRDRRPVELEMPLLCQNALSMLSLTSH